MEEQLFKTALEFINKYEIVSYVINFHSHPDCMTKRIRIQGELEENEIAINLLDMKLDSENNWHTFSVGTIDLTLTTD